MISRDTINPSAVLISHCTQRTPRYTGIFSGFRDIQSSLYQMNSQQFKGYHCKSGMESCLKYAYNPFQSNVLTRVSAIISAERRGVRRGGGDISTNPGILLDNPMLEEHEEVEQNYQEQDQVGQNKEERRRVGQGGERCMTRWRGE